MHLTFQNKSRANLESNNQLRVPILLVKETELLMPIDLAEEFLLKYKHNNLLEMHPGLIWFRIQAWAKASRQS